MLRLGSPSAGTSTRHPGSVGVVKFDDEIIEDERLSLPKVLQVSPARLEHHSREQYIFTPTRVSRPGSPFHLDFDDQSTTYSSSGNASKLNLMKKSISINTQCAYVLTQSLDKQYSIHSITRVRCGWCENRVFYIPS